jgi:hypothetical protein
VPVTSGGAIRHTIKSQQDFSFYRLGRGTFRAKGDSGFAAHCPLPFLVRSREFGVGSSEKKSGIRSREFGDIRLLSVSGTGLTFKNKKKQKKSPNSKLPTPNYFLISGKNHPRSISGNPVLLNFQKTDETGVTNYEFLRLIAEHPL